MSSPLRNTSSHEPPLTPLWTLINAGEFITNATSRTRLAIKAYHQDFVSRFKASPAILFWELGNEMNLFFDGCAYDKSPGAFVSTLEGLAWIRDATGYIKAIDPERPVNSGMGTPRSRAKGLMSTPGGGAACVTPSNPKGDCAAACTTVPADTEADFVDVLKLYYADADIFTAHFYGCAAPYGNLSWCDDPASTAPLDVFVATATALGKPLYVGEFGPYNGNWSGANSPGRALLVGMAGSGVPLSTLWAFECPSHDHTDQPGFCLHPGQVGAQPFTFEVGEIAQSVNRQLHGLPPRQGNMTRYMLAPPVGPGDPACLDGSAFGYYALPGKENKWVVQIEGGGWCFGMSDCFARTQPDYAGGGLGSSKYWQSWSWAWDFVRLFPRPWPRGPHMELSHTHKHTHARVRSRAHAHRALILPPGAICICHTAMVGALRAPWSNPCPTTRPSTCTSGAPPTSARRSSTSKRAST